MAVVLPFLSTECDPSFTSMVHLVFFAGVALWAYTALVFAVLWCCWGAPLSAQRCKSKTDDERHEVSAVISKSSCNSVELTRDMTFWVAPKGKAVHVTSTCRVFSHRDARAMPLCAHCVADLKKKP